MNITRPFGMSLIMFVPSLLRPLFLALLAMLAIPAAALAQGSSGGSSPYVFERDTINAGLPPADDDLYRDTPQALLESFMQAGRAEDWQQAAQLLDMTHLSPAEQRQLGPELARQLYHVVRRAMVLHWGSLPDRPDAVDATASTKDPMAGAARRSLRLASIDLPDRGVSVRISRVQAAGGEPQWLFARQTVQNVPELYAIYGPSAFEKALPSALRQQAFWTLAWWEVIAIPLVILIAFLAAALTWKGIASFRERYRDTRIGAVLHAIKLPAALFAFAGTFAAVRSAVFTFSGLINSILDPLQTLLIVLAFAAIFLSAVEAILDAIADDQIDELGDPEAERDRTYYTNLSALRRVAIVIVLLIALGIVLIQTEITQTLGFSMVASAGLLGLLLVFAARKMLGDMMASLQIAFAKIARIGDAVEYEGQWCHVETIGFTHVRLRTWDGRRIMAPVSEFVQSSFENWTRRDPAILKVVNLHLDHRADVDALREDFERFVADDDGVCNKDEAGLEVVDHTAQGMVLRAKACAPDPTTGWDMHCRMREFMLKAAAGRDAVAEREPGAAFLPREREVTIEPGEKTANED